MAKGVEVKALVGQVETTVRRPREHDRERGHGQHRKDHTDQTGEIAQGLREPRTRERPAQPVARRPRACGVVHRKTSLSPAPGGSERYPLRYGTIPEAPVAGARAVDFGAWRRRSGPTPSTGRARSRSTRRTRASTCSRERGFVQLARPAVRGSRARVPRPRVHGLEERRRHQLRADRHRRRRARLPRLLERGRRAPRQGRALHERTRRQCPTHRARTSRASAPTSAACARSSSSRRTTTPRSAASTATTTTASTPTTDGWVVRSWLELTDNPDSYMLLMDTGPDGLPDPGHRGARPAAPRRALRRRHAAALARRRAQRHRAACYALITSFESGPALDGVGRVRNSPSARTPTRTGPRHRGTVSSFHPKRPRPRSQPRCEP